MRSGLPVRNYLLSLPLAALAFVALAVVEESQAFLPALGLGVAPPSSLPPEASSEAEQAVRRFNAALERAYAQGSAAPLGTGAASPSLQAALEAELSHAATGPATKGLALDVFMVLDAEPDREGGWEVTTEETWASSPIEGKTRARLRFRYRLAREARGLRVDEMIPLLPEPVRGRNP